MYLYKIITRSFPYIGVKHAVKPEVTLLSMKGFMKSTMINKDLRLLSVGESLHMEKKTNHRFPSFHLNSKEVHL
jgi:hypothetical protein